MTSIIDLGTNTFHLMIAELQPDGSHRMLFRESRPAKIGKAGINQGVITGEATERALTVLRYFREKLDEFGVPVESTVAMGTSAIRNAGNQAEFIERIRQETGIRISVISGDQEATYIYKGVRASGVLDARTALIMDIGGGSVEFILCNRDRIFWKQSFEIGGQRLMERFMHSDPLSPTAVQRLHAYFQEQLLPLANAIHQYQPQVLAGSSGTFDTLVDMQYQHERGHWPPADQTAFDLTLAEFYRSYELLLTRNHDERMALPGMIELRVDMIVVAVCLIDYVLKTFDIREMRVSTYALKEGVLFDEE
ncbi:Ppx/GppA phosphatase family protein [Tellurirhabdus rosea]|uniref:Ppx/GppA phosphatase family protein n=1 Tax=Tellurirhabdus rosea TaxID=2674997 RepID=UPI00224C845E|nr:phosphatase [Tellurirhabdus rosea]